MSTNTFLETTESIPLEIVILGECMIELSGTPLTPLNQSFSGDTLNTAIYLKRLSGHFPINIHYATALGTDAFSQAMLQQWRQEQLSCDYVLQLPDKHPGIYFIQVDTNGERSFSYWRNDSAAKQYLERTESNRILQAIPQLDLLYISGISLAILPTSSRHKLLNAIKQMRINGGKLAFDNNYRPSLWPSKETTREVYASFMAECDLALLTLDDEKQLRGDIDTDAVLALCNTFGIPEVVIKRGAEPCLIQIRTAKTESKTFEIPANKVQQVVDTTAAGDSFSAAYIAGRLQGLSPQNSAIWGHALASTVIQHRGAIIPHKQMLNILDIQENP